MNQHEPLKSEAGGVSGYVRVRENRTIKISIVASFAHFRCLSQAEPSLTLPEANERAYELEFIKQFHSVEILEDGVDLGENFRSFFVALAKDGKTAEGFFENEGEAEWYCELNYGKPGPRKTKAQQRDFNPLEVEIV